MVMNETVEVTAVSETLSDGSKVWNVLIHNNQPEVTPVCVECVSEAAAHRMVNRLNDVFADGGV